MNWLNTGSVPLQSVGLLRLHGTLTHTKECIIEDRIAWGKKLARVVRKHGWKALDSMPSARLTALIEGRDGIRVTHVRCEHGRRWETTRFERVKVRTCKGKRR